MSAIVFIGPTVTAERAREHLDARYLPPAQQGDVYLAARQRPRAIGLIDGLFDQVDAVAHKEILWAMAQGIHVFGAASMGALRAAELHAFGMQGVGTIFEQYRDLVIMDDDEVAVAHASAEHDHRALSTALVDIRATLLAAVSGGHIRQHACEQLLAIAKRLFYTERSYPALLREAAAEGIAAAELASVTSYLRDGKVHQKQLDAYAMLAFMRQQLQTHVQPNQVPYAFSNTDAWQQVKARAEARIGIVPESRRKS